MMTSYKHYLPRLRSRRTAILLTITAANVIVFGFTNPYSGTSLLLIAGFVVLAVDIALLTLLVVRLLGMMIPGLRRHQRRLVLAVSSLLVVLLALASLGQLGFFDVTVTICVWLIGYMYLAYLSTSPKQGR